MMKQLLWTCLITLALSQTAISPWNVTISSNRSSSVWSELKNEYSFTAESGVAEWYFTNETTDDHAIIWLYLYSDLSYNSFVCITIPLKKPLIEKHQRFKVLQRSGQIYYDYYSQLQAIDSFPDYDLSSDTKIDKRLIKLRHSSVVVKATLISSDKQTTLGVVILLVLMCLKLASNTLKQDYMSRGYNQNNEDGITFQFTLIVGLGEVYWTIFTLSILYVFPPTITIVILGLLFLLITGFNALFSITNLFQIPPVENLNRAESIVRFLVAFYISLFAVLTLLFGKFSHISVLHTTLYAISPLFHLVKNLKQGTKPILTFTHWTYMSNIVLLCYIMGCPSCPLHHPQTPTHAYILLIIAVFMILLLTVPSGIKKTRDFWVKYRKESKPKPMQSKEMQVFGSCPLCTLPINYQPSDRPKEEKDITKGELGCNFHTYCLRQLSEDSQAQQPEMAEQEPDHP